MASRTLDIGIPDSAHMNVVATAVLLGSLIVGGLAALVVKNPIPLIVMGLGLPFFFVPLTALALGSVEEHETASAAGLQNFLRTLSGAVATSIVTTL